MTVLSPFSTLKVHQRDIQDVKDVEADLKELEQVLDQKPFLVDKIRQFTSLTLNKRLADHALYHCCVCNENFVSSAALNHHKVSSECWNRHQDLSELKQKVFICRICDHPSLDAG